MDRHWVAAFGHGVFRLDLTTESWVHFQTRPRDPQALSSNIVASIVGDTQGRIWLGAEDGGLNLFLPDTEDPASSAFRHWRLYNSDFPDDNVYNLSVDDQDRLWASTDLGLFTFDPATQKVSSHFLPLTIQSLNVGTKPGSAGILYVANAQSICRFFPDSLRHNTEPPLVFITGLQIAGTPVPVRGAFGDTLAQPSPLTQSVLYASSMELKHWQDDLTFIFTALNYIQPENNRYRYQLEDTFLQKLTELVHDHLSDEDFGIPGICRELNVSRSQLHRKLKALTGRSTSHVIRSIRLHRAQDLVLSTQLNISEIAYEVGFRNVSHFSTSFAGEFGRTPTEMRERRDSG